MTDFLNPVRLWAWCRILAVAMLLWAGLSVTQAIVGAGGAGADLGADFTCYYSASRLALSGSPEAVYDPAKLSAAEHADRTLPAGGFFPFYYPPPYLLLCLPLALLPYWPALILFLSAGLAPLLLALRRILPAPIPLLPALAFPGVLVTAGTGQNGFLSAACFAGFMLFADPRPILAGVCLGLLACKPHLAVLAPIALLAAGRWRSLAAAATTFLALSAASVLAFGTAPWFAFLRQAPHASSAITGGMADQTKIMSAFIAVRLPGGSVLLAAIVQAVLALAVMYALIRFIRTRPGGQAEGAALAAAALLATPYLADYDLACLAPPMAFALARGAAAGFGKADKILLMITYISPLLARGIAARTGLQPEPVIMEGLFYVLIRGATAARATQ